MAWRPRLSGARPEAAALSGEGSWALLARDPETGWRAFIDAYTPALVRLIERAGIADRDEAMEVYVLVCERLSANDCAALRRHDPAKGSLDGWLAVVVRRAVVDWVRARVGRRRLFAAIRELDRFHQRVFELYYWEGWRPVDIAQMLTAELGATTSLGAVFDALGSIDALLSRRHRSELVSLAVRSRPAMRLDDESRSGAVDPPADEPDPEAALHARELQQRLAEALASLPAEEAAIISLKYCEGLTRAQIQRVLRLPELTEHRVRSILAKLRALLAGSSPPPAAPMAPGAPRSQHA